MDEAVFDLAEMLVEMVPRSICVSTPEQLSVARTHACQLADLVLHPNDPVDSYIYSLPFLLCS